MLGFGIAKPFFGADLMAMLSQADTPLVDALQRCAQRPNAAFYAPGHKRGQGISDRHRQLLGTQVFRADLPELPELDNLFAPEAVIQQAQVLAAEAFGAEQTWFLANGSTCGVEAAILATCGPGDKILLPRNVHRSAIAGLILSGAMPVYLAPVYDPSWDLALGVGGDAIAAALAQHPDTRAVLVVSPTYQGICSDLRAIAEIVHRYNIPLIVDEAHGPHFVFHSELPQSALAAGADLAIQSTHKVLSALTQAAMLHVQGDKIDRQRLSQALQLTQSTSPSYLLLASLDAARHQMADQGKALMTQTLALSQQARTELAPLANLRVLGEEPGLLGFEFGCDRTRLTLDVSPLGMTGFAADDWLHAHWQVTAELPTLRHLTFIISLGNTPSDIKQLSQALQALTQEFPGPARQFSKVAYPSTLWQPQLSPRQAFFAATEERPLDQCIGYLSADTLCPYPPGIPLLLPGEPITPEIIAILQATLAAGGILTGGRDATVTTLTVIKP